MKEMKRVIENERRRLEEEKREFQQIKFAQEMRFKEQSK